MSNVTCKEIFKQNYLYQIRNRLYIPYDDRKFATEERGDYFEDMEFGGFK